MSKVDEIIAGKKGRRRGTCAMCMETPAAQVQLRLVSLDASGKQGKVRNDSYSLCDRHSAAVWQYLYDAFLEEIGLTSGNTENEEESDD